MIRKMKKVYKLDLESFCKGEMAFRKVKYLNTLSEKLSNVRIRPISGVLEEVVHRAEGPEAVLVLA